MEEKQRVGVGSNLLAAHYHRRWKLTDSPKRQARGQSRMARLLHWAGASHRPHQAADGWEKVFDFYQRHLG